MSPPFVTTIRTLSLSVLSLLLFTVAYITLGWGSVLAAPYTLVLAPFGAATYSFSLILAFRSGQKWLTTTIMVLGGLLGACVLLICVENFIYAMPNRRWIPVSVVLLLAVNCVGLVIFVRAKRQPSTQAPQD